MATPALSTTSSASHHHHHHHEAHPHASRKSHTSSGKRPVRPAFRRVPSSPTTNKPKKVLIEENAGQRDLDDMAASFPQYWYVTAICVGTNYPTSIDLTILQHNVRKSNHNSQQLRFVLLRRVFSLRIFSFLQMLTPNDDRCRRRDSNKPLTSSTPSLHQSPPLTPTATHHEELPPPRDIIPQLSPTAVSNYRFSYTSNSSGSSDNENETENDNDNDHDTADESTRPQRPSLRHYRQDSEAARYLRQFQSHSFQPESSTARSSRRPKHHSRSSTASLAPSLTNSPSPSTSPTTPISSLPYSRPLPPRTNPYSSSYGARSINLVTPYARPQSLPQSRLADSSLAGLKSAPSIGTDVGAAELPDELPSNAAEELSYEKKAMVARHEVEGHGHLRSLFRFSDMQAPPSK
jgi:hypothetical protein